MSEAWGNLRSVKDNSGNIITSESNIAIINPIRYRGYYYDNETGFYYLNSRYYDPEICRLINADGYISTGQGLLDNNMFAYCGNNPVNRADSSGMFWKEIGNFFKKVGTTNAFGFSADISQFKVGFEGSTTVKWDESTDITSYTDASVTGWGIAAAYFFATTGQWASSPQQQPAY